MDTMDRLTQREATKLGMRMSAIMIMTIAVATIACVQRYKTLFLVRLK